MKPIPGQTLASFPSEQTPKTEITPGRQGINGYDPVYGKQTKETRNQSE